MARKKDTKVVEVQPVEEEPTEEPHVVWHLNRDPNDPRNRSDTKTLPSLDD